MPNFYGDVETMPLLKLNHFVLLCLQDHFDS